ncbi:zeaxanthin epoxidase [Aquimarina sp. TRL1]|uniref:FAD-dependent monooxygenase n=1 Tax=Aquimarina sp. (strain TRL1) TaxID=2736252 RepID=UPI00158DB777|nr:FAD-dependent monooxygenase [Aquimarina sp. TRL1]QKX05828.1 zeaxanthin epoxidase [Aquimarina sp. TRL1]
MNSITIIGGGIGGIVTAICFEKLNIPYVLYERAAVLKEVGAGIWLSPNALQVLEWIDPKLLQAVQSSGNAFDSIRVTDHNLRPISDSNQQFALQKYGYTTMAIHRGKLQKILYDYATKENIVLNKTLKKYESYRDHITITFTDKSTVKTRFLIGADGINSTLRKQLFPGSTLRYTGQTCWRGIANYDLDISLTNIGCTLWGKKLQFGMSKLENGKVYWFAVRRSKMQQKDNLHTLKNTLTTLFSEFHPIVNTLIDNTPLEKIMRNDLFDLNLLERWHYQNICLIGDAAHSMTPDLGQGGAQAIEDAFYLSNFIHGIPKTEDAFDTFYTFRKPKVERLVKQSWNTSRMAITNRPLEILRNFILKYTPQKMMQQQMLTVYNIDTTIAHKNV